MKGFLAILFIAVLHQQVKAAERCTCGTFLLSNDDPTNPDASTQMYNNNEKTVASCDAAGIKECSDDCFKKISTLTDAGNLNFQRRDKKTVGEVTCEILKKDVQNRVIVVATKCGGSAEWLLRPERPKQKLCCVNKHYVPCT